MPVIFSPPARAAWSDTAAARRGQSESAVDRATRVGGQTYGECVLLVCLTCGRLELIVVAGQLSRR